MHLSDRYLLIVILLFYFTFLTDHVHGQNTGHIAAVWANEGGDKVTRDELRASTDPASVHNSVWDGRKVKLFGAKNEVVAFNLILEAPITTATKVIVSFDVLNSPEGATIRSVPATGEGVFNWVGRNI